MDEGTTGAEPEDYRAFGEEPAPRKGGTGRFRRPFGSGNSAPASEDRSGEAEEIEVGSGPSIRAGKQELTPNKRPATNPEKPVPITVTAAKGAAARTVKLINKATVILTRTREAEMTREEQEEITDSLASFFHNNAGVARFMGRWADPIALLIAAGYWGVRVYLVYREQRLAEARAALAAAQAAYAHAPDIQTARDQPDQPKPPVGPAPNDRLSVTDIQSRMAR